MLLETIKCEEGKVFNLEYHQARCEHSRKKLLDCKTPLVLSQHIKPPKSGLWRCRVTYEEKIQSIVYLPYIEKIVQTLKIVSSNIVYDHKYANRDTLNHLLVTHPKASDILIEKNGLLTDTSIANIAFYDGKAWFTPSTPLLEGTMRAKLLDDGFLQTKEIKIQELKNYTQVALMNAMIGFKIIKHIKIEDIQGNIYDY